MCSPELSLLLPLMENMIQKSNKTKVKQKKKEKTQTKPSKLVQTQNDNHKATQKNSSVFLFSPFFFGVQWNVSMRPPSK